MTGYRKKDLIVGTILDLFLQLDDKQRAEAFDDIRRNPIFCVECGMGSDDEPNRNCQCWNDE